MNKKHYFWTLISIKCVSMFVLHNSYYFYEQPTRLLGLRTRFLFLLLPFLRFYDILKFFNRIIYT